MTARIGIVSPMALASEAVEDAFAQVWPEAERVDLLDESLYLDFAGGKPQSEETGVRVSKLLHYAADCRADGLVFTGSVFGRWVEAARADIGIPCLTSYEAMIEEAFDHGDRLGIITTTAGTLRCLVEEIDRYQRRQGRTCSIVDHVEDAARPIILAGDVETHDRMVIESSRELPDCDVVMLGQFSLGHLAAPIAEATGRPTLTAPHSAVRKLKRLLAA